MNTYIGLVEQQPKSDENAFKIVAYGSKSSVLRTATFGSFIKAILVKRLIKNEQSLVQARFQDTAKKKKLFNIYRK